MSLAHVIVDVFTDTPLQGNQLAVFEDRSALSDDQMQRLAREMICPRPSSCFRPRRVHHKGPATGAGASRFSPSRSCGASLRTGLSARGRLQRYMSPGEQIFGRENVRRQRLISCHRR